MRQVLTFASLLPHICCEVGNKIIHEILFEFLQSSSCISKNDLLKGNSRYASHICGTVQIFSGSRVNLNDHVLG